jgi:hypothetical protein
MRTYGFPTATGQLVRVRIGEYLEVDDGMSTVMWTVDDHGVQASTSCGAADVTNSLTTSLSDLTDIPIEAAEPFMRLWLSEQLGVTAKYSIETLLERSIPSLASLYSIYQGIAKVNVLSSRLYKSLKQGSSPREISSIYWGDESTRSDGLAFISGIVIANELNESRVALMGLVPSGDERRKLAQIPSAKVWMVPPREVKELTIELSPISALKFAETAIKDSRSRLQLTAASALGLRAKGHDGHIAYTDLIDEVLRSELSAPRSIGEVLVADGPIRNQQVSRVVFHSGLKAIAKSANNCLGSPSYPWYGRVLRGEVELLSIGSLEDLSAVVAIDPKSGEILEMRGKRNMRVDPMLAMTISARVDVAKKSI